MSSSTHIISNGNHSPPPTRSALVVDEMDLKLIHHRQKQQRQHRHLQQQQQQQQQPSPQNRNGSSSSIEREDMATPALIQGVVIDKDELKSVVSSSSSSFSSVNIIGSTIGGGISDASSASSTTMRACPCCRRYIRQGEFCTSAASHFNSGGGGSGSSRYHSPTTHRFMTSTTPTTATRNTGVGGVGSSNSTVGNYSLDEDEESTLAGLALDCSNSIVSDVQGVSFRTTPGQQLQQQHQHYRHNQQQQQQLQQRGRSATAATPRTTTTTTTIIEVESVQPLQWGGGLAAYTTPSCSSTSTNSNNNNNNNNNYSNYKVKETIVQGWLHKKGTGNDFLGMRWWKPRWVTLALAQIPGQTVETPILIAHRAPGVTFPVSITMLNDSTVVMAIERTNNALTTTASSSSSNVNCNTPESIKEEWNTHCFQIVNTTQGNNNSSTDSSSVTRIFTAPLKERNEWVFAINKALMEYEKRVSKARKLQRPRSPSPVRMVTSSSLGSGLPPTSPRRVRSPGPNGNLTPQKKNDESHPSRTRGQSQGRARGIAQPVTPQ